MKNGVKRNGSILSMTWMRTIIFSMIGAVSALAAQGRVIRVACFFFEGDHNQAAEGSRSDAEKGFSYSPVMFHTMDSLTADSVDNPSKVMHCVENSASAVRKLLYSCWRWTAAKPPG